MNRGGPCWCMRSRFKCGFPCAGLGLIITEKKNLEALGITNANGTFGTIITGLFESQNIWTRRELSLHVGARRAAPVHE